MSFARLQTQQRFPYDYDKVFDSLVEIIPISGLSLKSQDKTIGRIAAKTGMSLFSYGENITVIVEKIDETSAMVSLESSLKVGMNLGGAHRHAKNFDKIIANLGSRLKTLNSAAYYLQKKEKKLC